ncbi:MAG: hypothetical protein ABSE49_16570 [Polyangiaceae bacterium]|jgi:hypothetical protein
MRRGAVLLVAAAAGVLGACAEPPKAPVAKAGVTAVELTSFEVRDDQVDRFEHCPPAGEIGQDWVPPIPEWHPPAASASAAVPESAVAASGGDVSPPPSGDVIDESTPASIAVLTDEASNQTRDHFRTCYHHGLLFDPTQDGHVAVVLRVDRAGKVASVETWGACDLAPEALVCMRDEAKHVHLRPPQGGSATVTIPAVFTNGSEKAGTSKDAYAASAYVAIEAMRPRLHRCEETAKYAQTGVFASALFSVDIDAKGRGIHVGVDQWKGGHELLACAAEVLRDAPFAPPPAGRGKVIVPVVFNPRPGTR